MVTEEVPNTMFLGRNRSFNQGGEQSGTEMGENNQFLNQANRPVPAGMQRFLAKKGINSYEDFNARAQLSPRMPFRKQR
jgi:hypothetical protein